MKGKPPLTLAEMAARSAGTGGRLVCPKCNCADLRVDKTKPGYRATFRRRVCRHCGFAFETVQQPEEFVREIESRANQNNSLDDETSEGLL
jgi:transcriptional regulator NrdR family protein